MKNELTNIPINFWDDFYEDGYVPEGEIQETYAYVEEYELLSEDEHKNILEIVFNYLKELKTGINIELIYHDSEKDYDQETVKNCFHALIL
jgi:hypothetical protein